MRNKYTPRRNTPKAERRADRIQKQTIQIETVMVPMIMRGWHTNAETLKTKFGHKLRGRKKGGR